MNKDEECDAVYRWGDHLYVTIYTRRPRDFFRKRIWLRCWRCNVKVMEP